MCKTRVNVRSNQGIVVICKESEIIVNRYLVFVNTVLLYYCVCLFVF